MRVSRLNLRKWGTDVHVRLRAHASAEVQGLTSAVSLNHVIDIHSTHLEPLVETAELLDAGSSDVYSEQLDDLEDDMVQPYRLSFDIASDKGKGKELDVLGRKILQEWSQSGGPVKLTHCDEILEEGWVEDS